MQYRFTDNTPVHTISGWFENESGLMSLQSKQVKGIAPFGPQIGIITEDKLTRKDGTPNEGVIDYLLGKPEWAKYLTTDEPKKNK